MEYTDEQIKEKEEELRQKLKDPNVMHEIMKDAYIPVGLSTADMIDAALQNADLTGESQDEFDSVYIKKNPDTKKR